MDKNNYNEEKSNNIKNYYNEEKANYIIEKLSSTKINQVYWKLIADVMLRRKFEYGLSDNIFERDVKSFIENVKTIKVGKTPKNEDGAFFHETGEIILNKSLFDGENLNFERIYGTFAHECTHAMNFQEIENGKKEDRTFSQSRGVVEAFTEYESNTLILNIDNDSNNKIHTVIKTDRYNYVTRYVDLIAATFGVNKKELLCAAINGKNEFQSMLNKNINLTLQPSGDNEIFGEMSEAITEIYKIIKNNKKETINKFKIKLYCQAQKGILHRLSNLEIDDINEFKEQFDKIKLEQKVIENVIINPYGTKEPKSIRKEKNDINKENQYYEKINTKMLYIEAVLRNDNVNDKIELIRFIQNTDNIIELKKFMNYKQILVWTYESILPSKETIKKYNEQYTGDGLKWNNNEIIDYIETNKQEIRNSGKITYKLKKFLDKILEKVKRKQLTGEVSSTETETIKKEINSWELSNWGIDKRKFREATKEIVKNHKDEKQITEEESIKLDEQDDVTN